MSQQPTTSVAKSDVEIANRGADNFLRLFYQAHDSTSQQRRETIPKFYRASSTINWNGTALTGADALAGFLARMPLTKHEVQSYDCHAIPGSATNGRPPSLFITVSGLVTHGPAAASSGSNSQPGSLPLVPPKNFDAAPRVFSQTFVLIPDEAGGGGEPKYYVSADSMRFVG